MMKFHKIQKISSIIPFWSTIIIAIITMVELKRNHASKKIWSYYVLTFFAAGLSVYLVNKLVMTGQNPLLNVIASGLILAVANIKFVDFQVMSAQSQTTEIKVNAKLYVVIFCVVVSIIGIGGLLTMLLAPSVKIEDTNGNADTSLTTITVNEIISSPDRYSAFSSYTSHDGSETNIEGRMKDYDHQECAFSCHEISGIMTLQATKTESNQLTLEFSSQLDEGNMEIVVIVDDEYYDRIPINQNSSLVLTDISGKTVVVRIAAESAKMQVSVKRFEDDMSKTE